MTLLPPNATAQETALEGSVERIGGAPVPNDTVWNPEVCPAALLPWLAWALSVDHWNPSWPESVKRQVIAASFDVHRIKGTIGALEKALQALDLDGMDVTEWFDFDGDPYTFRVDVELLTRGLTEGEETDILGVIDRAKNVRSHLDRLRIFLSGRATGIPQMSMALGAGETITVLPHAITELEVGSGAPVFTAAHYGAETVTINPQA